MSEVLTPRGNVNGIMHKALVRGYRQLTPLKPKCLRKMRSDLPGAPSRVRSNPREAFGRTFCHGLVVSRAETQGMDAAVHTGPTRAGSDEAKQSRSHRDSSPRSSPREERRSHSTRDTQLNIEHPTVAPLLPDTRHSTLDTAPQYVFRFRTGIASRSMDARIRAMRSPA